jgi:hypothetical protein
MNALSMIRKTVNLTKHVVESLKTSIPIAILCKKGEGSNPELEAEIKKQFGWAIIINDNSLLGDKYFPIEPFYAVEDLIERKRAKGLKVVIKNLYTGKEYDNIKDVRIVHNLKGSFKAPVYS